MPLLYLVPGLGASLGLLAWAAWEARDELAFILSGLTIVAGA